MRSWRTFSPMFWYWIIKHLKFPFYMMWLVCNFLLVATIYKEVFCGMQEELVSFANLSCSIFWSDVVIEDASLPSSVRGKLGGPSQRRLSYSTTTAVLQAVWLLILHLCPVYEVDLLLRNILQTTMLIFMIKFDLSLLLKPWHVIKFSFILLGLKKYISVFVIWLLWGGP